MWYLLVFASSTGWGTVFDKALSMTAHLRHSIVVPLDLKFNQFIVFCSKCATGATGRATLRANAPTLRTADSERGAAAAEGAEAGAVAGSWTKIGMEAAPSATGC
jgi:hypothetical protein